MNVLRYLHDEEAEEEPEEEVGALTVGLCVMGIVTVLIVVTIGFEVMEHHLVHSASKNMRPMISSLFGEMTVLGFLSLVTFCISQAGVLKEISRSVYGPGEEAEAELPELFEMIHMLLFFNMVLFIFKVLKLLSMGNATVNDWRVMNKQVQNQSDIDKVEAAYFNAEKPMISYADDHPHKFFTFLSMRKEFINSRSPIPPFTAADEASRLPVTFDYAEYLSINLGSFLADVVSLGASTWFSLWVLMLGFFVIFIAIDGNIGYLAAFWIIFGLLQLFALTQLEKKCHSVLSKLLNPDDFPRKDTSSHSKYLPYHAASAFQVDNKESNSSLPPEQVPLTSAATFADHGSINHNKLPFWTTITPVKFTGWMYSYFLEAHVPNRHLALFWYGQYGPELNIYLLRFHLLVRSVYISLSLVVFVPYMAEEYGIIGGIVYFFASMACVAWEYAFVMQDLITTMCHISCSGMLKRNQTVEEVVRKQKTQCAVRAIMMMTSLNASATAKPDMNATFHNIDIKDISQDEMNEIGSIFDMYDNDGSGEVDREELLQVMNSLGFTLSDNELDTMFAALDADGDGTVSRDEFIIWAVRNREKGGKEDMETKIKNMFRIFDKDDSGSITVSELVEGLKGLKHGLTTDDLVALANELDANGDGEISLHEFSAIIGVSGSGHHH